MTGTKHLETVSLNTVSVHLSSFLVEAPIKSTVRGPNIGARCLFSVQELVHY